MIRFCGKARSVKRAQGKRCAEMCCWSCAESIGTNPSMFITLGHGNASCCLTYMPPHVAVTSVKRGSICGDVDHLIMPCQASCGRDDSSDEGICGRDAMAAGTAIGAVGDGVMLPVAAAAVAGGREAAPMFGILSLVDVGRTLLGPPSFTPASLASASIFESACRIEFRSGTLPTRRRSACCFSAICWPTMRWRIFS